MNTKKDFFWNSDESIQRYANDEYFLFDVEKVMLFEAIMLLRKKISDIKVLDIGCGGGRTTVPLHNIGLKVVGLDPADKLIRSLQTKYPSIIICHWKCGQDLVFKNNSFDIVIFSHNSIDYLKPYRNRERALDEIHRVLKKDGFFIFSSHVFQFIPYNLTILRNILRNATEFSMLRSKGYFHEKMSNGMTVDTYSITREEKKRSSHCMGFIC